MEDNYQPETRAIRIQTPRTAEMGYSPDWVERQLAHEEPNAVRRTYNHADYFKDRAVMMQQWADLLDQWKKGESNVIPLKQERAA